MTLPKICNNPWFGYGSWCKRDIFFYDGNLSLGNETQQSKVMSLSINALWVIRPIGILEILQRTNQQVSGINNFPKYLRSERMICAEFLKNIFTQTSVRTKKFNG